MYSAHPDSGHIQHRKGKFVPVTTWRWIPAADDRVPQLGLTPPTTPLNYANVPSVSHPAHTLPFSQGLGPPLVPDASHSSHSIASSIPALPRSIVTQVPQVEQTSALEFPDYDQAFAPSSSAFASSLSAFAPSSSAFAPPSLAFALSSSAFISPLPSLALSSTAVAPTENFYQPAPAPGFYDTQLPFLDPPIGIHTSQPTWPYNSVRAPDLLAETLPESQITPDQEPAWSAAIASTISGRNAQTLPSGPFRDSPSLYNDVTQPLLSGEQHAINVNEGQGLVLAQPTINPLPIGHVLSVHATPILRLSTLSPAPTSHNTVPSELRLQNKSSRKRARSPGTEVKREVMLLEDGKAQGLQLSWQGTAVEERKLNSAQKAERRRKMTMGTCFRCKRLRKKCVGLRDSLYLPCESCRTSNPKSITNACILEASLLGIMLFRMGPPVDNPTFPLNFFSHRHDVFYGLTDELTDHETRDLELMQDNVGITLHLTVSRYHPLPGDKTAYEGFDEEGPYKLDMPPYCISDIQSAKESIVAYMRKAKGAYFNHFLDRNNALLFATFRMAAMCDFQERPLISKALDIWAATRLIERTWKLSGCDTLGVHPSENRSDPWKGFVPVTPIMDQQLDQVVIREVLVPRRNQLLNQLKDKVLKEDDRKLHSFEVYLTFFILLNNAEMQLAAEREFAQRYGFSGRFGPRGKYMDAEAQFHAARTMLGHFHYICRANCLLTSSPEGLQEMGLQDKERKYMEYVRKAAAVQKTYFSTLIKEHKYESAMYFCHQMLCDDPWHPGLGHIEEIHEEEELETITAG